MNEKLRAGDPARLRAPERVARMEVARVVDLRLHGVTVTNVLDVGTGTGLFPGPLSSVAWPYLGWIPTW